MNLFSTVLAQATIDLNAAKGGVFSGNWTVPGLIQWAITALIVIVGLIFFFMLILGGLKWVMSGGDKGQTEAARNQITAALIGIVIVFSAWAIAQLLQQVFQINILTLTLPTIT